MRDDFPESVKTQLAKRVGYRCSRPDCQQVTSGPSLSTPEAVNMGVAAHITAASPGGARYDPSLTPEQRKSCDNGIWLCEYCGRLVDKDEATYPVELLRAWKTMAEHKAGIEVHRLPARSGRVPSDEQQDRIPDDARKLVQEADFSLKLSGKFLQHGKVKEHFLVLDNNGPKLPYVVKLETWEPSKRWYIEFDGIALKHISWNGVGGKSNSENNPRRNIHSLKTQNDGRIGKIIMDTDWSGDVSAEYLSYEFTYFGVALKEGKLLIP